MGNDERPDYFAAAPSVEDTVLRGIKGNFRRQMIIKSLLSASSAVDELYVAIGSSSQVPHPRLGNWCYPGENVVRREPRLCLFVCHFAPVSKSFNPARRSPSGICFL